MKAPQRPVRRPALDVKCREDAAWYDGYIFLEGSRLRVHFEGFSDEVDEFWEDDCLKCTSKLADIMRLRSIQLQDYDCSKVSIGMVVCANFKTPDGKEVKYYDAKILFIRKRPHVKKKGRMEVCRCRFAGTWEAGPDKHKLVCLRCADMCFIVPESVEKHPIAHQVFQAARQHEGLKERPRASLYDEAFKENSDVTILQHKGLKEETEQILQVAKGFTDEPRVSLPIKEVKREADVSLADEGLKERPQVCLSNGRLTRTYEECLLEKGFKRAPEVSPCNDVGLESAAPRATILPVQDNRVQARILEKEKMKHFLLEFVDATFSIDKLEEAMWNYNSRISFD